ncbi:MAG TPA: InlB B-repeat-containing protein, partial [Clostridia bacterium]|nr:InlB B-repeat-containing protein [Clostridia bacterium]
LLVATLVISVFSFDFSVFAGNTGNASGEDDGRGTPVAAAPAAVYSYAINSYITGTSTAIIPARTGSTSQNGFVLDAIAQTIPGYFLDPFYQSPVSIKLTQPYTEVNFYYTARVYTLNFESNGGTQINSVTQNYQTPIVKPTNPVKGSEVFSGWYSDAECTQLVSWPYSMPYQGGTIYAGWTQAPVTITFNANNGTPVPAVVTAPGAKLQKPEDPTRNFFRFAGWYRDISFTQPVTWPFTVPTNAITLYAKWTYTRYTITFNPNGGTTVASITAQGPGAQVYPPNNPAKGAHTFEGWYYDNNTFADPVEWPITMVNDGFTLYAKWQPRSVKITFDSDGGSAVDPLIEFVGFDINPPTPPRRFGFVFSGWMLNNNPFQFTTMPPVDNFTLKASWTASVRASQVMLETYKTVEDELVPATDARAGDIVTVFLSAKTNFYCGASRFVIMYDSDFFSIVGANKMAVTPNPANAYYASAISSYAGATTSPLAEWPSTFVNGESSSYKFVAANFTASSQSANQGKPLMMDNDQWLYKIRLKVKEDASGSGKIFMDKRWDRSLTNTTGSQYYFYCPNANTLSSNGQSILDFDTDYIDANKSIELDTSIPPHSNIYFETGGGTPMTELYGEVGTPANEPVSPEREGYTFDGWTPDFPELFPEEDITLTARWLINTYYANFMVDGNVYSSLPFEYDEDITAPPPPSKVGYTFAGWSPDLGKMDASDKTFTALFIIDSYTAYFEVDGQPYAQVSTEHNAPIQAPPAPHKTGYTFTGWSPVVGNMPASDITFTAQFAINTYYAYFVVDGVTIASVPTEFGTQIVPPADPEKAGALFIGWSSEVGLMGAADKTFIALWDENIFDVVFWVDGSVYRTVPTVPGETIVIPQAPVKTGYTFTGWDTVPTVMPANDIAVHATWSINNYTLTFMVEGVSYQTLVLDYAGAITLPTAPVKQGYTFSGWSPVLPATMPAENITTEAIFTVNLYNAKFMVDGVVYAEVPTPFGAEIVRPANPTKEGYTFVGWVNVPTVMPGAEVVITATFTINTYTATFYVDGVHHSSVTAPFGTVIDLPSVSDKIGYTFTGWDPVLQTMPAGNINVNAIFTKNIFDAIFVIDGAQYAVVRTGYGESIQLPQVPLKPGHTFMGWSNLPTSMPNEDVTIIGTWVLNSYDAIFMVDGVEYAIVSTPYGAVIQRPLSPTKEGFFFGGWSPAVPISMPANTLEFTALWTLEEINLIAKPGSTTVIDQDTGLIHGLEAGITESEFIADFTQIVGNGELQITYYDTNFGTGTKVELLDAASQTVLKTYYVVIFGDVDGDGLISQADTDLLVTLASYQTVFEQGSAFELAADLTRDGLIDAFDLNMIKAAVSGISGIDQTNPGK